MKQDRQKKLIKKLGFQCDCEACDGNYPTKEELQKASSDLAHIELPSWPYLDPSSTVELAIQRYKHYCALLQSTPELLLNNYDGILVTEYIISCVMKIIAYEPKMF